MWDWQSVSKAEDVLTHAQKLYKFSRWAHVWTKPVKNVTLTFYVSMCEHTTLGNLRAEVLKMSRIFQECISERGSVEVIYLSILFLFEAATPIKVREINTTGSQGVVTLATHPSVLYLSMICPRSAIPLLAGTAHGHNTPILTRLKHDSLLYIHHHVVMHGPPISS